MKFVLVPHEQFVSLQSKAKPQESTATDAPSDYSQEDKLSDAEILSMLPKRAGAHFGSLLTALKQQGLDWNRDGELVINEKPIKGSHICDLLHFSRYSVKAEPLGAREVFGTVRSLPKSLLINPKARQLLINSDTQFGGQAVPPPGLPASSAPRSLATWAEQWKAL